MKLGKPSEDGGVKQDDCSGALSGPEFTILICVMRARFSFLLFINTISTFKSF